MQSIEIERRLAENRRLVKNRRLVYLGAIDDKVVQYKPLLNPVQQLNSLLFFSTILGDPLVLNDGYLLHSDWGWNLLLDPDSPVRQLNTAEHLIFASRSKEPYSEWVRKQAPMTESYDKVVQARSEDDFQKLDSAQSAMKAISWPDVNVQVGLNTLLGAQTRALVEAEIPSEVLNAFEGRFGDCVASGRRTVRDCWENVLIKMEEEKILDSAHKNILMEVANEAYHVNFAAGLATMNGGRGVGVSGYGKSRFDGLEAYRHGPQQMAELLQSDDLEKYYDRLSNAATVRIAKNDTDLCGGGKLAQFLRDGASAKEKYRQAWREFAESSQPLDQRVEALETSLKEYAKTIDNAFGVRTSERWVTVINFVRSKGDWVGTAATIAEGFDLMGHPVRLHNLDLKAILPAGQHALYGLAGVVGQLRGLVKHVTSKGISLLPEWNEGLYELDLDQKFVEKHTTVLPPFRAA